MDLHVSTLSVNSSDRRDVSQKIRPFCSARVTLPLDPGATSIDRTIIVIDLLPRGDKYSN